MLLPSKTKRDKSDISDKSQLVFSYQACVDIKGSQSQTEQAECIGSWKEGSTYYFAAILNSSLVTRQDREDSYRWVSKQLLKIREELNKQWSVG